MWARKVLLCFLRLLCINFPLGFVVLKRYDDVTNQHDVGDDCCETAGVGRIACVWRLSQLRGVADRLGMLPDAEGVEVEGVSPENMRLTLRKYEPMGKVIMAKVKTRSLAMVALCLAIRIVQSN